MHREQDGTETQREEGRLGAAAARAGRQVSELVPAPARSLMRKPKRNTAVPIGTTPHNIDERMRRHWVRPDRLLLCPPVEIKTAAVAAAEACWARSFFSPSLTPARRLPHVHVRGPAGRG